MDKIRLGDIATLINGDRGKNYPSQADIADEGDIPFVNAGHLNGRSIEFKEMNYISRDKFNRLSSGKFFKGDVLYCLRGSLGKKAIVKDDVEGAIASSLVIIRPDYNRIDGDYLMFSLDSPSIKEQLIKANNGSSQPNLSAASVREYQIELPDLKAQKDVVNKLAKVRTIIDSRQHEIDLLDDLIKARFVEMFGSIKSNDKGWDTVQLKDIADVRGRVGWKGYKKEDLRESGPLVLGATHLTDSGELDLSAPVYLSREKYEESPEIVLQKNDLIFTQRGNTIGKVGLVAEDIGEATINPCVLILRPLNIHPIYFKTYFVMDETKDDMWMLNSGSAQPMITQKGIGEYQLMIPPIELQNQFADFVKQVDKSKVVA